MSYVDGFVLSVPEEKLGAYRDMASKAGEIWKEYGALAFKECVLEDADPASNWEGVPENMRPATFPKMADIKAGETVIFSFILYKSRAHRDEVNAKVMADPRMNECGDADNMPFDCARMAYGGFKAIVDL